MQADLKAIQATGGFGASVMTAVTAQNTLGVTDIEELPPSIVTAQFDAVFADISVAACKSGMLANKAIIRAVADSLRRYKPRFYVLDPVMVSSSGHVLLQESAIEALKRELFPLATVVTPNVPEAERLTGRTIRSARDAEEAGRALLDYGPGAVLVKGGHLEQDRATDILVTWNKTQSFPGDYIEGRRTHGAGCAYASAIATLLGRGKPLAEAIRIAKSYVTEAIREGPAIGGGGQPLDHLFYMRHTDPAVWQERLSLKESRNESL